MGGAGNEGEAWARQIQDLGWRQGCVFRPPEGAEAVLPGYLDLKPDEWLVVCTQSCSVCSKNFDAVPLIEVIAASPIAKFNPSHGDAKGKSSHTFHLPIKGVPGAEALLCKLGRRAFIPRRLLLDWRPHGTWLPDEALNSFKGWLANYYMRIALPDRLMDRLHAEGGIRERVREFLAKELGDGRIAEDGVVAFYIKAGPDEDLPPERLYEISLVVVCEDDVTREFLDRQFGTLKGSSSSQISVKGVIVSEVLVKTADDTTLAELAGKSRLNDWDDMSPLPERLAHMQAAV